jgi:hypothetical protein
MLSVSGPFSENTLGVMPVSADTVRELVKSELAGITQVELADTIRPLLVDPRCELRPWNYSEPEGAFPCWVVLEHTGSGTCVVYCEEGFGPSYPWGLLFLSEPHMDMGMDAQWFLSLEDAARGSPAWDGANPPGYEVG